MQTNQVPRCWYFLSSSPFIPLLASSSSSLLPHNLYEFLLSDGAFANDAAIRGRKAAIGGFPVSFFCESISQSAAYLSSLKSVAIHHLDSSEGAEAAPPSCTSSAAAQPAPPSATVTLSNSTMLTVPSPSISTTLSFMTLISEGGPSGSPVLLLHEPPSEGQDDWSEPESLLVLSSSKWSLFFNSPPTSVHHAVKSPQPFSLASCHTYFKEYVFVFTILTWHVGHLILDVLEPLYNMLKDHSPQSVRLVIDVANEDEKNVLHEFILRDVYEKVREVSMIVRRSFSKSKYGRRLTRARSFIFSSDAYS